MNEIPLNHILKNNSGWYCNVFEFNRINAGGLYISYDDFLEMTVHSFKDINFRIYKKTKKVVVSGKQNIDKSFCAFTLSYPMWKCLLCKKISNFTEHQCFCESYSKCWTPINGEITGVAFSNEMDFNYHFEKDSFFNLII